MRAAFSVATALVLLTACGDDGGSHADVADGTRDAGQDQSASETARTDLLVDRNHFDSTIADTGFDAAESLDRAIGDDTIPPVEASHDGGGEAAIPTCAALLAYEGLVADVADVLQACIDQTPTGGSLALPPGRYLVAKQVVLARPIDLGTAGKTESDPPCDVDNASRDCFEMVADAALLVPSVLQSGMLWVAPDAAGSTLDHLMWNGNNLGRLESEAAKRCIGGLEGFQGYNVTIAADHVRMLNSVSRNALCGTGMEVDGKYGLTLARNVFAYNGVHHGGLWADGLTVTDAPGSQITDNRCIDNTDVDFIVGGCAGCVIRGNQVTHGSAADSGAFAAMMLTVWGPAFIPNSSGDFTGADIAGNLVDCGADRRCGFGLNIGTDAWAPDGPMFGGDVHDNVIRNTKQGLNVSHTTGVMHLYRNLVTDAGGVLPTSCGVMTLGSYNVSTTSVVDLTDDDVPASAYTHLDWPQGCVPSP